MPGVQESSVDSAEGHNSIDGLVVYNLLDLCKNIKTAALKKVSFTKLYLSILCHTKCV